MMCKKLIYLVVPFLALGLASRASAELIAQWKLDEGSGTTAVDATGNGHDGTLEGSPQWGVGYFGGALQFAGSPDRVVVPYDPQLNPEEAFTVSVWANVEPGSSGWRSPITSRDDGPQRGYIIYAGTDGNWQFWIGTGSGWSNAAGPAIQHGEWTHVAATYAPGDQKLYINGEQAGEATGTIGLNEQQYLSIGAGRTDWPQGDYFYVGMVDDVRLYDQVLSESEIGASMENQGGAIPKAYGPSPADGEMYMDTWVSVSWRVGDFAASHDVYMGEDYQSVEEASRDSELFRGNQTVTFFVAGFPGYPYPDGLVPGTTYYWRIDEVNDADPNSPWKGDVWSFSIPPKTAYYPDPADGAEFIDPNTVTLSWTEGFGAILHTVYLGDDYDQVNNATGGIPQGITTYRPDSLEREKVYYWRVDEFDGAATYKGDIWSFTTPGAVGNPQPSNNAPEVGMNATLSWTSADSAASHELYIGTSKETVRTADTGSPEYKGSQALGAESYDPGLLEPDTTYYWRVDEVYAGNTIQGPVWSFSTGAFLLVEDFESYTDDDTAGQAIWQTWIDGFGIADNGAQVGYLLPPYAEQTIVHGGSQSMPLLYVNEAGVTNSEALMTLTAGQDWTQGGVEELSLWFRGDSANVPQGMYVAISNTTGSPGMVVQDDAEAVTSRRWTEWRIPLQAFADQGINLANVNSIAIGIGSNSGVTSADGSGTVYVDDIRLYRPEP
jgi:hypothetical protein